MKLCLIKKKYQELFFLYPNSISSRRKVVLFRLMLILTIIGFLLSLNSYLNNPPSLEEAQLHYGKLIYVSTPGMKGRGHRYFEIINDEKKESFISYNIANTVILKNMLGKHAKVWSYERRNVFFFNKNVLVEIEIDGEKIINNWADYRSSVISEKNIFVVLVFLMASVFFSLGIFRLIESE